MTTETTSFIPRWEMTIHIHIETDGKVPKLQTPLCPLINRHCTYFELQIFCLVLYICMTWNILIILIWKDFLQKNLYRFSFHRISIFYRKKDFNNFLDFKLSIWNLSLLKALIFNDRYAILDAFYKISFVVGKGHKKCNISDPYLLSLWKSCIYMKK